MDKNFEVSSLLIFFSLYLVYADKYIKKQLYQKVISFNFH